MGKFKKCPRCDLNYILESDEICEICKEELNGVSFTEFDDIEDEILEELCPSCHKNFLEENETICSDCVEKQQQDECRKEFALEVEDDDRWEDIEEEDTEDEDLSLDIDLSLESLKEEEEDWDTNSSLEDEDEE